MLLTGVLIARCLLCVHRYNEIYLPLSYLLRGLHAAVEANHPSLAGPAHEAFVAAVRQRTNELALTTESACHDESMSLPHRRRGTLLAANVGGPFINIDRFLSVAMATHEEGARRRQLMVEHILATFDSSGDGLLQRGEFEALVQKVSPSLAAEAVHQLWTSCGGGDEGTDGVSGADGAAARSVEVDAAELEAHLFHQEGRSAEMQRALNAKGNPGVGAGSGTGGGSGGGAAEMEAVLSLWDSVKDGVEHAQIVDRCLGEALLIVRLQARVRGAHARRRVVRRA